MKPKHTTFIKEIFAKNKLSTPQKITSFPSGQINFVYDIDGKYVIKIEGKETFATGIFKHQAKLMGQLDNLGVKVPRVMAVGDNPVRYLLMEKIPGRNLVYGWKKFSKKEKESLFAQVADQLRLIHSLSFVKFSTFTHTNEVFSSPKGAMNNYYNFYRLTKIGLKPKYQDAIEYLEKFYQDNLSILEGKTLKSVCIHNDFHFGNIFHNNGVVTGIIDWDWSGQMPKEYELQNFISFCLQPAKYVEKKLEINHRRKLTQEIHWLKKYYPELFFHPRLLDLIRLFYIPVFIDDFYWHEKGRWNDQVLDDVLRQIRFIFSDQLGDFIFSRGVL